MTKYFEDIARVFGKIAPMECNLVAGVVIVKDGKTLLVKQKNRQHWTPPGGLVEWGEDPKETCIRETEEEIGVRVTILKPLSPIVRWHNDQKRVLIILNFLCSIEEGEIKLVDNKDEGDIAEMAWVNLEKLKQYDIPPGTKEVLEEAISDT